MDKQNKKLNPEETPKDEKIQLTDDEAEKAAGGRGKAGFKPIDPKTIGNNRFGR